MGVDPEAWSTPELSTSTRPDLRPATTMTAGGAYDLSEDYESVFEEYSKEGDARLLFANFTSSLLIVNSTLLAYAALALAALGALAYLFYYLTTQNSSSGGYGYGSSSSGHGVDPHSDPAGCWQPDVQRHDPRQPGQKVSL